jgi:hypothetical protein
MDSPEPSSPAKWQDPHRREFWITVGNRCPVCPHEATSHHLAVSMQALLEPDAIGRQRCVTTFQAECAQCFGIDDLRLLTHVDPSVDPTPPLGEWLVPDEGSPSTPVERIAQSGPEMDLQAPGRRIHVCVQDVGE